MTGSGSQNLTAGRVDQHAADPEPRGGHSHPHAVGAGGTHSCSGTGYRAWS